MYKITVHGHFSAAHFLENYAGLCGSVHGHRWEVVLSVKENPNPDTQMIVDFSELKEALNKIMSEIDHSFILDPKGNEASQEFYALAKKWDMRIYPFTGRTTAENIAKHIWYKILESTGWTTHTIEVFEAPGNSVVFGG